MTDRRQLGAGTDSAQIKILLEKISSAAEAGVDWVQIREKDLDAAALSDLVREAIRCVPPTCKILVNDRLDVACALRAAGVHLGEKSIPVGEARRFALKRATAKEFLIGASVHSLEAALAAQKDGADYLIFGPVFATPSKAAFGDPQGLERLKEVCNTLAIPVLGIGGITLQNAGECYLSGASGVAAIRLFQKIPELAEAVTQLRACGVREPDSRLGT